MFIQFSTKWYCKRRISSRKNLVVAYLQIRSYSVLQNSGIFLPFFGGWGGLGQRGQAFLDKSSDQVILSFLTSLFVSKMSKRCFDL